MPSIWKRSILCVPSCLLVAVCVLLAAPQVEAGGHHGRNGQCVNCRPVQYGQPDLFYNYYVPGTCGGVPAQMYISPHYVPATVGHTYITYQPMMPHELLYTHHRAYYRYYDGGRGMTRTSVRWYNNPIGSPLQSMKNSLRIAR